MSFDLTILGSSAATPTSYRHLSSQVLHLQGTYFLIDCGEGTQMQMRKYHQKFQKIDYILISHLHGDHCFGLAGLISSMHLLGRKNKLIIFGPKDLEVWIRLQLKVSQVYLDFELEFRILEEKKVVLLLDTDRFQVFAIPLKHRIYCNGFLFKEKDKKRHMKPFIVEQEQIPHYLIPLLKEGKKVEHEGKIFDPQILTLSAKESYSYAYISDTIFDLGLAEFLQNTTVLYHEATFLSSEKNRAKETFHSTATQAATLALQIQAKKLLLGHISARYIGKEHLFEQEAKAIFSNSFLVQDGENYSIEI